MRDKVFKPDEEQLIDIHEIKVSAIPVINTPLLKTKDLGITFLQGNNCHLCLGKSVDILNCVKHANTFWKLVKLNQNGLIFNVCHENSVLGGIIVE